MPSYVVVKPDGKRLVIAVDTTSETTSRFCAFFNVKFPDVRFIALPGGSLPLRNVHGLDGWDSILLALPSQTALSL